MKSLLRYIAFALTICAIGVQGQQPTQLPVYDLTADSSAEVRANAIQALNQGYMLRFVGASEEDIEQIFGTRLGDFKILDRQRSSAGLEKRERLVLKAIAGYRDAQSVPHVLESYAPENDTGQDGDGGWQGNLDAWIAQEQAKAAQLVSDDPTPPADTWIKLYYATVQARSSVGNVAQETMGVYRLASTGSNSDYYMVYTIPQVTPDFDGCNGYDYCGWHTTNRGFHIVAPQATSLADHGPTGTVGSGDGGVSVTIGADLSATFSFNWSQPDVTTIDTTVGTSASWAETFNVPWPPCNPFFGNVPGTSKSTFLSRQGTIFAVPSGTQQVNFSIGSDSGFCMYTSIGVETKRDGVSIAANLPLGPPQLFAAPQSLTIPAGGSATLLVSAFIPNSPIGFTWTAASSQSWLTIPSGGPFSGPKALQVSVASGTPDGAIGAISINSSPPFAAPSVERGPIEIPVTVGTPPSQNTAGVLIFGGLSSPNQIASTPEYYDPSAKIIVPTGTPVLATYGNTAITLTSGDILIAGGAAVPPQGVSPPVPIAQAQLFHPASKTFTAAKSMIAARHSHTATLLLDGKVLMVGGYGANGLPLATAELYDPATGAFSATGSLNTARAAHAASLLSSPGQPTQVIVYGGTSGGKVLNTAEIWTESTGAFTQAGSMAMPATGFPAPAEFQDLGIILAGGYDQNFRITPDEQLIDPQSGAFSVGKSMNTARAAHTLTRLASGDLIAIGGVTLNPNGRSVTSASVEKRTAGGWALTSNSCPGAGCLLTGRANHIASILPDGSVLVAGGVDQNGQYLSGTELFDPASNTFSAGPLASPRAYATAVAFATSTTTLTASPNPAPVGGEVALVATVTALMSGTPQGTVIFRDGPTPLASVALSNGQALFNTSTLTVGSHTLTADYSGTGYPGASTSPPVTVVVQKGQTTATLVSSPNPSTLRQTVTLRATISPANASGTVTFQDGSVALGTVPVANGVAHLPVGNLTIGSHSITAVYSGDAEHASCTSPAVIQGVTSIGTSTSLHFTPPKPTYGQNLTLTATVTSAEGTPTGNVTFQDSNAVLGTAPLVNGTAIFHTIPSGAGNHTFEAAYSGSSDYAASSASLPVFVRHAATSVGLTSSLNPAPQGQTVTFTATVSVPTGTPTGSVTFQDGATHLATVILTHGVAMFATSTLALGTHLITGAYSGDSNFAGSTSPVLRQTISPAGKVTPTVTLTVNGGNSATIKSGDTATFAVRVHAVAGYPWPTGSVTISDSTNADNRYGAGNLTKDPNSNDGIAVIPIAWRTPGSYTLLATYGGDNEGKYYNGAQSNTVALQVSPSSP